MGEIAQRLADVCVVTSDNPRSEAPQAIVDQIVAGLSANGPHPQLQLDRRAAIEHSVLRAASNDVVLLAGKGHETTQEVAGVKHPFSDVQVARTVLRQRGAAC
jgi:UDP-N-acetylmuramoyl-L-alanyl-D-glutamate--2,6-diaminopimelate ligase